MRDSPTSAAFSGAVCVRFAPSPTGYLHLGGARTALYNYVFTRRHGGIFILRIEDTDLSRSTDEAIAQIVTSLSEMGLDWDEGPGKPGSHGPYRQTERHHIYAEHVRRLRDDGWLYPCFCSAEQLEAERQRAQAEKRSWVYGGACRELSSGEAERRIAAGEPWTLRFRVPDGVTSFHDMLRGPVEVDNDTIGDFIVQRSDGTITYNLAVVVDDVTMEITHVIRGDDHISNTPKQILIYRALGAPVPSFLHMPLLFGTDKKKLSKRHGATQLEQLTAMGYLPEVVRNYLCFLSTEFDESMIGWTLADLVDRFDVEQLGRSASIFDPDKLRWMNARYIRELDAAALGERLVEYLTRAGFYGDPQRWVAPDVAPIPGTAVAPEPRQEELTRAVAPLVQEKIELLSDVAGLAAWFFHPLRLHGDALERLRGTAGARQTLQAAAAGLSALEGWHLEGVEALVRGLPTQLEVKPKAVFAALRLGMSGQTVTPGLFESLWLLGREDAVRRLEAAASLL